MSTFQVTAERLTIHPHPNADALELAEVGLYRAVVGKGVYKTGDWAVYIPEQAILPEPLIEELGLVGRLAGKAKNRVKAVRLRGELSQGIVCRPTTLKDFDLEAAAYGVDFAEQLGIVKWVPDVPVHMAGEVAPAPDLLGWPDIENIKRHPELFTLGEPVTVTEKIHGTCCLLTHIASTGDVYVTSKGNGQKHLAIKPSDTNLYWRAVRGHGLIEVAAGIAKQFGADRVGLYGEVYGAGIQDLGYGVPGSSQAPGFALFDIRIDIGGEVEWLAPHVAREALDAIAPDLPTVPVLYDGPFDLEKILALADGLETVSGDGQHIREGVVVRSSSSRYAPELGSRAILKAVSAAYLTRKDGTEFE